MDPEPPFQAAVALRLAAPLLRAIEDAEASASAQPGMWVKRAFVLPAR